VTTTPLGPTDHPDPTPAATPPPGLADLKKRLNIPLTQTQADPQLGWLITVATAWVDERVYPDPDQIPGVRHAPVVEAILILASRLYARRNTPEGVAGWPELGVTRVVAEDPDLAVLLERHEDYTRTGFA
jgi:hypothetical protein